jgi:hypothetical protein
MNKIYDFIEKLYYVFPLILPTSSEKNIGIDTVRGSILTSCGLLESKSLMDSEKAKKEIEKQKKELEELKETQTVNKKQLKKSEKMNRYRNKQQEEMKKNIDIKKLKESAPKKNNFIFGIDD